MADAIVDARHDARRLLEAARAGALSEERLPEAACALADALLRAARPAPAEVADRRRVARMLADPQGPAFTADLAERVLLAPDARSAARQLAAVVRGRGLPAFLAGGERLALAAAVRLGRWLPGAVVAAARAGIRRRAARVIRDDAEPALAALLELRRRQGLGINLNQLGEAVLGEEEAARRLAAVRARLAEERIAWISVKLSALFSQASALAHDWTVERFAERLRLVLAAARDRPGGPAFVNLDMEEYRDLAPTVAAFTRVLDEPGFHRLSAGMVLQAYLPDSHAALRELAAWARARRAAGGAWIRLRIVKGANLAMERVEARLRGWPCACYATKAEVDASYKRLLDAAIRPEHADALRIGVASHNLFDIAWALLLREARGLTAMVGVEMLEGMAEAQALALAGLGEGPRLYAPVVAVADFTAALAYLVRRLDENAQPGNFLRDLFAMAPGSSAWAGQRDAFLAACRAAGSVATASFRSQDRGLPPAPADPAAPFANAPDSDWTAAANRAWLARHLRAQLPEAAPVVAGGGRAGIPGGDGWRACTAADIADAVSCAVAATPAWDALGIARRRELLLAVATVIERRRGEAIAAMVHEGRKVAAEADSEVSEAVDFAAYYARALDGIAGFGGCVPAPLGPVVVAPPWNFPFAIPAGGVLAALMAGNAVILKPAPETVRTAALLAACCWEAGIPHEALQFAPCRDDEAGRALVSDPRLGAVVLTGAWETARMFLDWRPGLRLLAETSGKNALTITAAADADQAVRDLVRSAFGHAGQKCSAASLALVEGALLDDPRFLRRLRDAAASLPVGQADDPATAVPPLIRPPGAALTRGLTSLDPGEAWLLQPHRLGDDPCAWSPGIRIRVKPDGWFAGSECFGPVLGVVRVDGLDQALELVRRSPYGLTGGIHTLDPEEAAHWCREVAVGNAYVNRAITGAIVRRQPFGGWRRSAVGPGAKAGGPNYVLRLAAWRAERLPPEGRTPLPAATHALAALGGAPELRAAASDGARWWEAEFGRGHDPSGLAIERNVFRYRPLPRLFARLGAGAAPAAAGLLAVHAATAGVPLELSADPSLPLPAGLAPLLTALHREDDPACARRFAAAPPERVRLDGAAGDALRLAIADAGAGLVEGPVLPHARLELMSFLREQSVSATAHRHGQPLGWDLGS